MDVIKGAHFDYVQKHLAKYSAAQLKITYNTVDVENPEWELRILYAKTEEDARHWDDYSQPGFHTTNRSLGQALRDAAHWVYLKDVEEASKLEAIIKGE